MNSDYDDLNNIFRATKLLARLAGWVMNASHTAETRRFENAFKLRVQYAGPQWQSVPVPDGEKRYLRARLHQQAGRDVWGAVLSEEEIDFLIDFLVRSAPDSFIAACQGSWNKDWIASGGWGGSNASWSV